MKKKKYLAILSIVIMLITASTSYAFFNSSSSIKSVGGNDLISLLNVINGKVDVKIESKSCKWKVNNRTIANSTTSNPKNNSIATYSGLKIINNSNLTSNINIGLNIASCKDGGMDESNGSGDVVTIPDSQRAKLDPIWVGDIDNFGYGYGNKDPMSGAIVGAPYPDLYEYDDPEGTDKRMVTSGFYNYYISLKHKDVVADNKRNCWCLAVNDAYCLDGYTYNAIKEGKLEPVKPITFKYGKLVTANNKDGKVANATIQVMLNDIQPYTAAEKQDSSGYSRVSDNHYKVTLNGTEIPEFSNIINNLNQYGPRANLVTLRVPSKYLDIIKKAEGNQLDLKIDDASLGCGGDSYGIDFACLKINEEVQKNAVINVKVLEEWTNDPIEGVFVSANYGVPSETDEKGCCEIKSEPGQIILNATHPEYYDVIKNIYNVTSGQTIKDIIIYMAPNGKVVSVKPKTKFKGSVTITQYSKNGEEIRSDTQDFEIGSKGRNDLKNLNRITTLKAEPGYYYLIDYRINLIERKDIDKSSSEFTLQFNSQISVVATQENNSGWNENGG